MKDPETGELLHTIGWLAKECGISQRTIHFYESEGLVAPTKREGTGYRYYGAQTVERIEKLLILKRLGLSLDEIKDVIDLYFLDDLGVQAKRSVLKILQGHLENVDKKMSEMTGFRDDLIKNIVKLESAIEDLERS